MRNESWPHGDSISTCSAVAPLCRSSSAMCRVCSVPKRLSVLNYTTWNRVVTGAPGGSANGSK